MTKTLRTAASVLALSMGALSVAALAPAPAAFAEGRGFTAKDMVQLERISDPRVSPDGRFVVYSVRTMDYAANKASMSLWIADLKARMAPRRLAVSDGGASSPRWSPDGKALYFVSGRTGGLDQVYRTDAAGETSVQVTKAPFDVGAFKIAPDGKTIVIAQAVFPDCDTLECTKDRLAAKGGQKTTGVVYDKLFIRHWDTWADGTQNHLYALKLDEAGIATGAPVALMNGFNGDAPTKPFGGDEDFAITPDGKTVVFSAKLADREESWSTNYDLWRAPLDGSAKPENTTEANKAWDAQPSVSPDGKVQAWLAMKRPGFEADRFAIMVREGDKIRELSPAWDRSAQSIAWSADGKTIYTTAEDVGQTKLFAVDVKTGKVTALTGEGHVSGFSVGPQSIVYAQDNLKGPAQLYALSTIKKGEAPIKLTNNNAEALAGVAMGEPEQFSFPGWNGETVHGYLVKPANFDPAKKYPVAFLIHGGPQGSFGNLFHYRWNAQTYAGAGYAVVMIDFHGSTGYGQAFTDAISQHWGDRPLEDLQKGWAFATGKYGFLDKDRACALGGSYGGFMINWIASQWKEPWKCLVDHDGIFDSRFMGYSTEELWFSEWENGGPPYQAGTTYSKFNPADHVDQWSVPELVVQGGQDFRVPLEEGIGTFTALQRKGVPSKLLYFPNENHWVLKAQNSVQWHDEVLKWLDQWTKGEQTKQYAYKLQTSVPSVSLETEGAIMFQLFRAISNRITLQSRLGGRYAEARVLAAELDLDLTEIALRHGSQGYAEGGTTADNSQAEREEKFRRLTEGFNSPYPSEQIAAAVDLRKWMVRDYGLERLRWFVPQLRERYIHAIGPKAAKLEPIVFAPEDANRAELEAEALSLLERLKLLYTLSSEREVLTGRMRRWALGLLCWLFLALMITRLLPNISPPGAIRESVTVIANFSLIAFVGAAGAMVSVLRRTESAMASASSDIDPVRQVSALSQGLTAVFIAAFVGMSVSFVLVAFFASGLVREGAIVGSGAATLFPQIVPCRYDCPITLVNRGLMFPAAVDAAKMMVWAFIGGFSEQLVPDVLDRLTKAARQTKKPSEAA